MATDRRKRLRFIRVIRPPPARRFIPAEDGGPCGPFPRPDNHACLRCAAVPRQPPSQNFGDKKPSHRPCGQCVEKLRLSDEPRGEVVIRRRLYPQRGKADNKIERRTRQVFLLTRFGHKHVLTLFINALVASDSDGESPPESPFHQSAHTVIHKNEQKRAAEKENGRHAFGGSRSHFYKPVSGSSSRRQSGVFPNLQSLRDHSSQNQPP